jgi:hypothetical protein
MKNSFIITPNQIDTFDSFYGNVFSNNDTLVIPYINLGISEHYLNPSSSLMYINKSYLILQGIVFFKENHEIKINQSNSLDSFYLGGTNTIPSNSIFEFEIKSKSCIIQLIDTSSISESRWLPIQTKSSKPNMDIKDSYSFLNDAKLPDFIAQILNT